MMSGKKLPLIGLVLWTETEPKQINYCIEKILKLFVDLVSIGFPPEKIEILTVSGKQISIIDYIQFFVLVNL